MDIGLKKSFYASDSPNIRFQYLNSMLNIHPVHCAVRAYICLWISLSVLIFSNKTSHLAQNFKDTTL